MTIQDLLSTLEKLPSAVMTRLQATEQKFETLAADVKAVMADVAEMKPLVDGLKGIDLGALSGGIEALTNGSTPAVPVAPTAGIAPPASDTGATAPAPAGAAPVPAAEAPSPAGIGSFGG